VKVCGRCGRENPEDSRFCGNCGASLEETPAREERKVVTVLFADLVDFTSRAERMDPEDVRAMLSPYYERLRAELERYGGTVEKFIGDAVVGLFGAPVAHEDDPERAVRAALAIREAIEQLNESNATLDLHVRIGVNTGEALVALGAQPGQGEGMAAGDVVNTAARLQTAAPTDGILVGEATHRATAPIIDYRPAEPVRAKGKSAPIGAWQAMEARSRLGVDVARTARTELVGREREVALLRDGLARSRAERSPQLVTLVGEPGIGKTRLVFELLDVVDRDPELIFWRQGRCLPYGEGVSFWALGEMVKAQAGILETDPDEEAAAKLSRTVGDLVTDPEEAGWMEQHLRPLVGLEASELRDDRQAEAFSAWRRFLEAMAEVGPAVLVFEDLHWADDGLLDFIDHLVDWAGGVSLLVLCTARPELLTRRPGWGGGKTNSATVSLSPLSEEHTARLIGQLLHRSVLPADVQSSLMARAGGNPLYAEEFARMAADRGPTGELEDLPLPESLQGIIAARLDALNPGDKALLQDAAVLGKVFWLGALAAIGGIDRTEAEQQLHQLERRQFVRRDRRSSVAGETEYAFWHILIRDVAYGQIPRARRAEKHGGAAAWIAGLASDRLEDRSEMLAHHYRAALDFARAAGQPTDHLEEPARTALWAAGERALALNSFSAAQRLFGEAVDLWPKDHPDRPRLVLRLGRALWLTGSTEAAEVLREARDELLRAGRAEAAAEAEMMLGDILWREARRDPAFEHFDRARTLVAELPTTASKTWVLAHVSRFLTLAGRDEEAIALGREVLGMAESLGLADLRANALNNIGVARTARGDRGGLQDLEASLTIAEEAGSAWDVGRGYLNLASVLHLLGDVRRARELHDEGMKYCERYWLRNAITWLRAEQGFDRYHAGEWDAALDIVDEFIAETEAGAPHYMEQQCRLVRGNMRMARGDAEGAVADSGLALEAAREAKDPQAIYPALGEHARLLHQAGRRAEAEVTVDELLQIAGVYGPDLTWSTWFLPAAYVLGGDRGEELLALAHRPPQTPWIDAGKAMAAGDPAAAAEILASMGSKPEEAFARLVAGETLWAASRRHEAEDQLGRALAFHRSVGATAYVARAEALLRSTA
jgi:class 3 adenylate cyclase/tetratricopeptide (TPR) repeat protein